MAHTAGCAGPMCISIPNFIKIGLTVGYLRYCNFSVFCYQNYCIDHNNILHSDKDDRSPSTLSLYMCGRPITRPTNSRRRCMADGRHLEKNDKAPHLSNGLNSLHKIWPKKSLTVCAVRVKTPIHANKLGFFCGGGGKFAPAPQMGSRQVTGRG